MSGISLSRDEKELARVIDAANQLLQGRSNAVGEVTLTAGATTTVVDAVNFGKDSYPFLVPLTANAAAALATTFVSARVQGGFTLTHSNNAQIDKTFGFVGLG